LFDTLCGAKWLVKIALSSFSEEVVVHASKMHGDQLVTMTTKGAHFLTL
jgi:hypothetical protein